MLDTLIINVFNKAKQEIESDAITPVSKYITDVLWDRYKYQISDRTLRNYYNKAITTHEEQNLKISLELSQHFSQYLGYEDYYNFILSHKQKIIDAHHPNIIFPCFILSAFFLVTFMIYHYIINNQHDQNRVQNHKNLLLSQPYITDSKTKFLDSTYSYKIIPLDENRYVLFGESKINSKEIFSIITLEELSITHLDSLTYQNELAK